MRHHLIHPLYVLPAVLLLLLANAGLADAQVVRNNSQQPQDSNTADRRLEPTPLEVESLGLRINPPAGANISAQKTDGRVSVVMTEPIANPRWSITMQLLDSTLEEPTPAGQVQDHLDSLNQRGAPFEVLSNKPITINGLDGQLCYLRQQTTSGQQYVSGWLILPAGRRTFFVASSLSMPDSFRDFQPTIEASFNTIELTSQEELSLRIRARIEAGRRLLDSITKSQLESIAESTAPQWRRIYRPAEGSGADQEVGYMMLDVFAGKRGLLNPGRNPQVDYDASEHEVGLFVRAAVRVLEGKDIRDVQMLYWMAWDQGEEQFSVRGTRRQGEASISEAISGVRIRPTTGDPMATLTVITMGEFTRDREPMKWNVPDVYLSQALNWILPQLLPRDQQSHTFGYYYFDMSSAQPGLQRRIDNWEPADTGPGQWKLSTTMGDSDRPLVSFYDSAGRLIRREHPDGSRTEPIELAKLRQLWMRKGLPMNTADLEKRK